MKIWIIGNDAMPLPFGGGRYVSASGTPTRAAVVSTIMPMFIDGTTMKAVSRRRW
jgi:hypothetical protein